MTKYRGWLVVEERPEYMDKVYAEYTDENDERQKQFFNSVLEAIEWWDKRLGGVSMFEPTLKGCYRVFLAGT